MWYLCDIYLVMHDFRLSMSFLDGVGEHKVTMKALRCGIASFSV
jgi:hypothetical protein